MWQLVLMINGYFISILGGAMLIAAGYDIYVTSASWSPFLSSALMCLFIGLSLFLSNRAPVENISIRQGYLLTTSSWVVISLLAAVPFMLYGTTDNFHDALFESISGLSTTGATILTDIEGQPKAILLWRSMLTAMGGAGIVMFAVALLPFLGIGGMQMFQRENSDFAEYQRMINSDPESVPSHAVIKRTIKKFGEDYRYEDAPNPVAALRPRDRDNTTLGRVVK